MGGPGGGANELRLAPNAHLGKGGAAQAFGGGGGSGGRGCGGGGGGGGRCLLHAELQERRVQGQGGPARKAPKLPAMSGGQPLAAKPPPAAHVDAWVAAQAGAMPEWQKRAVAAEGGDLLLRGKLREAEQRAQERGAAGNGNGAGAGLAACAGPQTQAQAGAAAGGGGSGWGGQRQGRGGERQCEVPHGGKPGLEVPGREEGGALSSGRHRAPAAWPARGGAVLRVGGAGV